MGSLGGPGGRFFFVFLVFVAMSMNAKKTSATMIYHKLIFYTLPKEVEKKELISSRKRVYMN